MEKVPPAKNFPGHCLKPAPLCAFTIAWGRYYQESMCGGPHGPNVCPSLLFVTTSTRKTKHVGAPRSASAVRQHGFFEMLASTKSSEGHKIKIVRFLGHPLFLLAKSAFYALARNWRKIPLFWCNTVTAALPRAHPATQPPQNDVFGSATSKYIILGRFGAGLAWGEG